MDCQALINHNFFNYLTNGLWGFWGLCCLISARKGIGALSFLVTPFPIVSAISSKGLLLKASKLISAIFEGCPVASTCKCVAVRLLNCLIWHFTPKTFFQGRSVCLAIFLMLKYSRTTAVRVGMATVTLML